MAMNTSASSMNSRRRARFDMTTAAHHFLLSVVPFRRPHSHNALRTFVRHIDASNLPAAFIESVMVRALAVLDRRAYGSSCSLLEQYVTRPSDGVDLVARFTEIVDAAITRFTVSDPIVRRALTLIQERYADHRLTRRTIARDIDWPLDRLARTFYEHVGVYVSEYLRAYR